jgi:L-aminopeptidase/D-esterase-like protein
MKNTEHHYSFKNLEIGTAEYPQGPTGCTVFYFPEGAIGSIDIRGGSASVREAPALSSSNSTGWLDALVFAGGSTYGLESADGVASEILKLKDNKVDFMNIPVIPAAVVYDFDKRDNAIYPDKSLGAEAFRNKTHGKALAGRIGAGANVNVGKYLGRKYAEPSGQAVGHYQFENIEILTVSVVNALGNILDHSGNVIAGTLLEDKKRYHVSELVEKMRFKNGIEVPKGNTTLTAVITNAKLNRDQLERIAIMAHTSMGKNIAPFHTPNDGDVFFAISTQELELNPKIDASDIAIMASKTIQDSLVNLFKS